MEKTETQPEFRQALEEADYARWQSLLTAGKGPGYQEVAAGNHDRKIL